MKWKKEVLAIVNQKGYLKTSGIVIIHRKLDIKLCLIRKKTSEGRLYQMTTGRSFEHLMLSKNINNGEIQDYLLLK